MSSVGPRQGLISAASLTFAKMAAWHRVINMPGRPGAALKPWLRPHWAAWSLQGSKSRAVRNSGGLPGGPRAEARGCFGFTGPTKIPKRQTQHTPPKYFPGSCCCGKWQCLWSLLLQFLALELPRVILGRDGHASGGVQHKMEVPGPSDNYSLHLVTHELITAQHLFF